jgi:hypothetical protein
MAWGPAAPKAVESVPVPERRRRVKLTSDTCVIDGRHYFVRACLDLRILGESELFSWLVWIAVAQPTFRRIRSIWRQLRGRRFPPVRGELATALQYHAPTLGLAIELRDAGVGYRPWAFVRDPAHELGQEQRVGIPLERAYELAGRAMHEWTSSTDH